MMLTAETLITVFTSIVLPSVIVIFLTFVPSIIEWKRPHDAGPRPIQGFYKTGTITTKSPIIEVDTEIGASMIPRGFCFPAFISNIEALVT